MPKYFTFFYASVKVFFLVFNFQLFIASTLKNTVDFVC